MALVYKRQAHAPLLNDSAGEKSAQLPAGVTTIAIGLGSPDAGAEFAAKTGYPADKLYADPVSACYKAMGFSRGALPDANVSGYAKLLLMLAGIEAPGTMQVRLAIRRERINPDDSNLQSVGRL